MAMGVERGRAGDRGLVSRQTLKFDIFLLDLWEKRLFS